MPKYVGVGDELTRADVLTVTTSVVDGGKLPDATLDKLWADEDGDGFSEHWDALLSQPVSHAVLFEVDPDADYIRRLGRLPTSQAQNSPIGEPPRTTPTRRCARASSWTRPPVSCTCPSPTPS